MFFKTARLVIATTLCAMMLLPITAPQAKQVSDVPDHLASRALSNCAIESDAVFRELGNAVGCCSKKAGYCVACEKGAAGKCKIAKYRKIMPPWFSNNAPSPGKLAPKQSTAPHKRPSSGIIAPNNGPAKLRR